MRKPKILLSLLLCFCLSLGYYLLTPNLSLAEEEAEEDLGEILGETFEENLGKTEADAEAILHNLYISDGQLLPEFNPAINEYTIDVVNSVASLDFTALVAVEDSSQLQLFWQRPEEEKIEQGNGIPWTCPLETGVNSVNIKVYNPSADLSNTYSLHINRVAPDPNNANLWSIKTNIGAITPAFDPDSEVGEYAVNVDNIIKTIEITVKPADSIATLSINEGAFSPGVQTTELVLEPGENLIPLVVIASNEITTRTYTLNVIRGPSSNADLKELRIYNPETSEQLSLVPEFTRQIVTYTVNDPDELSRIELIARPADPQATLTINDETVLNDIATNIPLDEGGNLIPIVVTAPDEVTEKAYILSINGKVSNADLANLSLKTMNTNFPEEQEELISVFDSNITNYEFSVDYSLDSLTLSALPDDQKALLMFDGRILPAGEHLTIDLSKGDNTHTLMVIAQDTTTKAYTLKISRHDSLAIVTAHLPLGLYDRSYIATLTAQGGYPPYTWSTTEELPAGLVLAPEGEITGNPEATGTFELEFTVTDDLGNSQTKNLTLTIELGYGNSGYLLAPLESPAYTIGTGTNSFPQMKVNTDTTGLQLFPVKITPVKAHLGEETIVFVQMRNEAQIGINTLTMNFELIPFAFTLFEVQPKDVIKIFIVDDSWLLTTDVSLNLSADRVRVGNTVTASGMAEPNTWLTIKIIDEEANIIYFETVRTDNQGHYSHDFNVPYAPVRSYLTVIAGFDEQIISKELYIRPRLNPPEPVEDSKPSEEDNNEDEENKEDNEDNNTISIKLTIGNTTAHINDEKIPLDTMPLIEANAGRTIVPLRFIGESLGAEVEWLPSTRQIVIRDAGKVIILWIDSYNTVVNGNLIQTDCPPRILKDNRTFVPVRFVSEMLNAKVDWNEKTREISIRRNKE